MIPACGRIRERIKPGINPLITDQLQHLQFSTLSLTSGQEVTLDTGEREFAAVLIHGQCEIEVAGEGRYTLGPRENPFEHGPYAYFATRENRLVFRGSQPSLIGIGSAPAQQAYPNSYVTPDMVSTVERGADNWTRTVRMICWSTNTAGNMLLAGETCTPSGNWSTIPPHRHQFDIENEEAPYEEVYFFRFSRPQGFGLTWQFDDDNMLDQAFSLQPNDVLYMAGGYHPVVCAPGGTLYHLSLMAGPKRISKARVHQDYRFLLEQQQLPNQYTPQ